MDPIVNNVIQAFLSRSERGIEKYGTTLHDNDLSELEWIQHHQEELMDAILYAEKRKQIILERNGKNQETNRPL